MTASGEWPAAVPTADVVDWRQAMRLILLFALPTGVAANMLSLLGAVLMAIAAALVVLLYMRNRRPAWITTGAGARIGLVLGLLAGWVSLASAGVSLFVMRFGLHQGKSFDDVWLQFVQQQAPATLAAFGLDAGQVSQQCAMLLSPDGQAGFMVAGLLISLVILLVLSVVGGAVGARLAVRRRRSSH